MFKKHVLLSILLCVTGVSFAADAPDAGLTIDDIKPGIKSADEETTTDTTQGGLPGGLKDASPLNQKLSPKAKSSLGITDTNLATRKNPYLPDNGPFTLLNCSGGRVSVETFNENDAVMWVPYATVSLSNGKSSPLKCASAKCKVRIKAKNVKTGAITNYWVLKGSMLPTNKDAVSAGCSVF